MQLLAFPLLALLSLTLAHPRDFSRDFSAQTPDVFTDPTFGLTLA